METYLVDLALHESFPIPEEKDRSFREIANRLAAKMRAGEVTMVNFDSAEGLGIDNQEEGQIPVVCNETWFEIILGVEYSVDVITSREPIFNYVIEALENREGVIEAAYDTPGDGCLRSVIRITLQHLDTSSMDDYEELMSKL